jgi:hypothetical protein
VRRAATSGRSWPTGAEIKRPARSSGRVSAEVIAQFPQVTLKMSERYGRLLALQGRAFDRRPNVVDELANRVPSLSVGDERLAAAR